MTRTIFDPNIAPTLLNLDGNFTDTYGLLNLFTTPTYTGTGSKFAVDAAGTFTMTDGQMLRWGASYGVMGSTASGFLDLYAAGAIAVRLDGSKNMLVGAVGTPTSTVKGCRISADLSVDAAIFSCGTKTAANTTVQWINGNGAVGSIVTSGASTTYNTSSDRRLKGNIVDAGDAGPIIDAMRIVAYDWRGAADSPPVSHGFIAQELISVFPAAVSAGDDGDVLGPDSIVWGIDPSKMIALLVKEIQSLRARVSALEV